MNPSLGLEPSYLLTVARDYVSPVGKHLVAPLAAGDLVYTRWIVCGKEDVITGSTGEHVRRAPVVLAIGEEVVAIPARDEVRSTRPRRRRRDRL